jgi:DNA polymerase-3 subunit beta
MIDAGVFGEMIDRVVFATQNEEQRYPHGVLFINPKKGILRMVGTDGCRLALIQGNGVSVSKRDGVVVPKRGLLVVRKVLKKNHFVGVRFEDKFGFFKMDGTLVAIRLIDEEFPPYEEAIPKNNDKRVVVGRDGLLSVLKRIGPMANSEGVLFSLKEGRLELFCESSSGHGKEVVEVDYKGPEFQARLDVEYLTEAFNSFSSEHVLMEFKEKDTPVVIRSGDPVIIESGESDDQFSLIMPMRT